MTALLVSLWTTWASCTAVAAPVTASVGKEGAAPLGALGLHATGMSLDCPSLPNAHAMAGKGQHETALTAEFGTPWRAVAGNAGLPLGKRMRWPGTERLAPPAGVPPLVL